MTADGLVITGSLIYRLPRVSRLIPDHLKRPCTVAFEFELEKDFEEPRRDISGAWAIDFALGYDTEEDIVVVMSVMLVPGEPLLGISARSVFDLQFGIRLKTPHRTFPPNFDKETGRKYIPKERNSDVLRTICSAAELLVTTVEPDYITMETFHPNLDPKALVKYEKVNLSLKDCGYTVAEAFREPSTGINYWCLRRG